MAVGDPRSRRSSGGPSRTGAAAKSPRDEKPAKPPAHRSRRRDSRTSPVATRDSELTTAQILDAAIELIESEGESGVRVHQLARKAGRTMGAVYHHFESREGVIEAARALQFRGRIEKDVAAIDDMSERCREPQDFVEGLVGILRASLSPERLDFRWTRVDVVGCARARPRLAGILGAEQHRIAALTTEVFRKAQARGLLRADVDVESLALLAQQATFAFVLSDIDPGSGVDADRYARFLGDLIRGLAADGAAPARKRRG